MSRLTGVIAPIHTPFDADGRVVSELFVENARRCLDEGCVAIAPFGTTGEALSVALSERRQLLEDLVAGGIAPERLIPGTGLTNLIDTADLTRHAVDLGCHGTMALPPFYFKGVSDAGLIDYFSRLIDLVDRDSLQLYLYHIPQVAGVGIPVAVAARLRAAFPDQIVGIKDSSGDWQNTLALMAIDGLIVYPSSELVVVEAMEHGAAGCISATANLNAHNMARLVAAKAAGDDVAVAKLHEAVKGVRRAVEKRQFISVPKRVLALLSGDERWANVRPPLRPATEAAGQELLSILRGEYGVLEP